MLIMNLADENSVREAVKSLDGITLKAIANNAGIMNRHFQQIADGTELTIAVNYKNTRLLNELLIDSVAEGGVIAFTSSLTRFMYHKGETVDNLSADQFHQLRTYGLSKRMLTDYARELSVRLAPKGVRVNCADPGIVDSSMITMSRWYDPLANIFFRPFIRSPRHGAIPMLRALQSHLTAKIFCRYRIHSI
jgi:NAD(P)-dependent dehydrogenase (short-subunit alcohol dehydrogenase family)